MKKINSNNYLEKKIRIKELSQKKKIFSERVKLLKLSKRKSSPKPRQETSLELIKRYSLKVLETNRSSIKKEIIEKSDYNERDNLNVFPHINIKKPRNLPPLMRENYSSLNLQSQEKN